MEQFRKNSQNNKDCNCNQIKLTKGLERLIDLEKNNKFDYIYLKCKICKDFGEYYHENYYFCISCNSEYCTKCIKKIYPNIKWFKFCKCIDDTDCANSTELDSYIECDICGYYYCNNCKLKEPYDEDYIKYNIEYDDDEDKYLFCPNCKTNNQSNYGNYEN